MPIGKLENKLPPLPPAPEEETADDRKTRKSLIVDAYADPYARAAAFTAELLHMARCAQCGRQMPEMLACFLGSSINMLGRPADLTRDNFRDHKLEAVANMLSVVTRAVAMMHAQGPWPFEFAVEELAREYKKTTEKVTKKHRHYLEVSLTNGPENLTSPNDVLELPFSDRLELVQAVARKLTSQLFSVEERQCMRIPNLGPQ